MAIDSNWVRENPEEAARQMDVIGNAKVNTDIQIMTSFVRDGSWPELAMLSSSPELEALGEALNELQVKHHNEVVDLIEQRDQYRAAEEAQIALREKSQARVRLLAAHVVDIGGHLKGYAQHLRDAMSELPDNDEGDWKRKHLNRLLKDVIAAQEHKVPTDSVSRLIDSKQADILSECIGAFTSEALKAHEAGQQFTAEKARAVLQLKCSELRRKAEGGA
ncbi:hypothetical protein [Vreelandella sp. V005]|uniref:hypothetical protein n=1 Tax=Vreelandella sp. V005 TaxID=3459608 RepID=UPI00404425B6